MIMPSKHIELSESLIGLGAFVVSIIEKPITIDECWNILNKKFIETKIIRKRHSFDTLVLTIDMLYMLGLIEINEKGELYNALI